MSARRIPREEIARRIEALWRGNGIPYRDVRLGGMNASSAANGLGFRRSGCDDFCYVQGPCVRCHEPFPVKELNAAHICAGCADPVKVSDTPKAKGFKWERAQSRKRMKEREAGLRPSIGQPRTPIYNTQAAARAAL